jgi:threonine/homoserine efflux transporter RhtA
MSPHWPGCKAVLNGLLDLFSTAAIDLRIAASSMRGTSHRTTADKKRLLFAAVLRVDLLRPNANRAERETNRALSTYALDLKLTVFFFTSCSPMRQAPG